MVLYMAKKEIDAFNIRFDKVIEGLTEIKVEAAGIREHLKTLNGKVASHEQRFTDVYQEFQNNRNTRSNYQESFRNEIEKLRNEYIKNDKEQDDETKKVEKMLWETKIQLAGIAVVVPIIISLIMWLMSKLI